MSVHVLREPVLLIEQGFWILSNTRKLYLGYYLNADVVDSD